VCAALESLQSGAPSHAPALSVALVEAAFNRPLRELFSAWEEAPIASGSIAQIHRARLSPQAAASCGVAPGTLVAVKVRHPGVEAVMARDFVLMQRAAAAAGRLPALKRLRLDESVRQFGGPLQEQLNLAVEAQHLSKFARNFRSWRNVKFPVRRTLGAGGGGGGGGGRAAVRRCWQRLRRCLGVDNTAGLQHTIMVHPRGANPH
jgi:aarF domain-containing kinase